MIVAFVQIQREKPWSSLAFVAVVFARAVAQAYVAWDRRNLRPVIVTDNVLFGAMMRRGQRQELLALVRKSVLGAGQSAVAGCRARLHSLFQSVVDSLRVNIVVTVLVLVAAQFFALYEVVSAASGCGLTTFRSGECKTESLPAILAVGFILSLLDLGSQLTLVFRHDKLFLRQHLAVDSTAAKIDGEARARAVKSAKICAVLQFLLGIAWIGIFIFAVVSKNARKQFGVTG